MTMLVMHNIVYLRVLVRELDLSTIYEQNEKYKIPHFRNSSKF